VTPTLTCLLLPVVHRFAAGGRLGLLGWLLLAACQGGVGSPAPVAPDAGPVRRADAAAPPAGGAQPGTPLADAQAPGAVDGKADGPPVTAIDAAPMPPAMPTSDASDELFDPGRVPRFDIEITPAAVAELEAAIARGDHKHFVRARFRHGTEVLEDVGLRIKGESSRTRFDEKPALKLKFDEFVNGRDFRGLRRLTLNNMFEDPSGIAERLSYHLFRLAGLPAPRANSALLFVNGQSYGLYVNVESVDKTFLRRWFTSDAGNLYEEGQQDFLPGKETTFELETNEMANDRSDLRALITALGASRPETLLGDLGGVLDVEHFLRFTAVEGLVNQWDMYGYTRFYPNNFHFYSDPQRKFVFLPWGLDMTWKPFHDGAPHLPLLGIAHRANDPRQPVTAGLVFQRCLASPPCRTRYLAVVQEMLGVMEGARLDVLAATFRDQIRPHQRADARKFHSDAVCETSFQTVVRTIRDRPARVRQDLAANPAAGR
jgi:CotH kinase protein